MFRLGVVALLANRIYTLRLLRSHTDGTRFKYPAASLTLFYICSGDVRGQYIILKWTLNRTEVRVVSAPKNPAPTRKCAKERGLYVQEIFLDAASVIDMRIPARPQFDR